MENSPSIQSIDKKSVHQICSGQVVLDLATAVKELVENSLDAGAENIEIKTKEYGKELIEVSDNGSGIEAKDFQALALKHYTSKLKEFNDLSFVDTFGFRGEALSSLSALSNMFVTTQHKNVDIGSKLEFDHNGKLVKSSSIARTHGTTVCIGNIFNTLPVRYKEFHRNFKKDFAKLIHVLYSYSLINSDVRFNCVNIIGKKKNLILSTNGKSNTLDIITSIFGSTQSKNIVRIVQEDLHNSSWEELDISQAVLEEFCKQFVISGYISKVVHGCGRSSPDRQFFFINKRPCDFPKLSRIVNEVYHQFNRHQYPFIILDISLSKEYVDINVTPDKRMIMIHEEKVLFAIVKSTLKKMFENYATYYEENVDQNTFSSPCLFKKIHLENISPNMSKIVPLLNSTTPSKCSIEKAEYSPLESNQPERLHPIQSGNHLEKFRSKFDTSTSLQNGGNNNKNKSEQPTMNKFFNIKDKKRKLEPNIEQTPTKRMFSPSIDTNLHNDTMTSLSDNNAMQGINDVMPLANAEEKMVPLSAEIQIVEIPCSKKNTLYESSSIVNVEKSTKTKCVNKETTLSEHCNVTETYDDDVEIISSTEYSLQQVRRKRIIADFDLDKLKKHFNKYTMENNLSADEQLELTSFRAKIAPTDNKSAEDELRKHVSKDMFVHMEIIGQFNLGFIITKLKNDLFIVDQHATDEKYNYETLQAKHCLKGQKLIQPLPLELTLVNKSILVDNIHIFEQNGFDFEVQQEIDTQDSIIKLIKVPTSRNWTFSVEDVEELIFMLSESPGVMCRPSRVRQMFASRACRISVMVGTALRFQAMKKLVTHMSEIDHPWNCPHGRPTMRHLVNLCRIDSSE